MSVRVLIIGTPSEIKETARRLSKVTDVVGHSNPRPSRKGNGNFIVHVEAELERREQWAGQS